MACARVLEHPCCALDVAANSTRANRITRMSNNNFEFDLDQAVQSMELVRGLAISLNEAVNEYTELVATDPQGAATALAAIVNDEWPEFYATLIDTMGEPINFDLE